MHHQTRPSLWAALSEKVGPAQSLLDGQNRLRLYLLAGIAVALIVACWPRQKLSFGSIFSEESTDSVPVLVAEHYLSAFQTIKPEDVHVRNYPKDFVPAGALHSKAELITEAGQMAFSSLLAIPQGEPLTRTVLAEAKKNQGLSLLLTSGNVAVSISVDKCRSAGGWVQPGDTVALYETLPIDPSSRAAGDKRTRLLLSAVKVLAVDKMRLRQTLDPEHKEDAVREMTTADTDTNMLTVLVNPVEAERIVEARESGPITVVLRAIGDDASWVMEK
jgi:Flp pilus assembly protein CpaB